MSFRASWTNSTPATLLDIATSSAEGDVLVAYAITDGTGTVFTWPTGFVEVAGSPLTVTYEGMKCGCAVKEFALGSEGTLRITCDVGFAIGGIVAFSGRDNSISEDVAAASAVNNTATAALPTTSSTPVTDGVDLFGVFGSDVTISGDDPTHTFSTSSGSSGAWTTREDQHNGFHNVGVGSATQVTAGAVTATCTRSMNTGGAFFLLALRPAAAAGTAALTGTAVPSATKADIVAGGKTIVATLTGDTWVAGEQISTISYVGGQKAGRANASSALSVNFALTGGTGTVPLAGDIVVVTVVVGSAAGNPNLNVVTPTGYTSLTQLNRNPTTADTSLQVSYKVMGATPDTAVTIPGSTSNAWGQAYAIQVFRGVDPTTPMDATPVSAVGSGTNNRPDPPAITPVTAGAWVVTCGGGAAGVGTTLFTGPTNFTTNFISANGADSTDGTVGCGYWSGWTSGAVDPGIYGGGSVNAANSWCAYSLALRPKITNLFGDALPALIAGLDSAQAEAAGWDAVIKPLLTSSNVIRTSSTVVTVTLPAAATYDITAQEVITWAIPASALTGGVLTTATPTVEISVGAGTSVALTGVQGAGAVGTVVPSVATEVPLSGVQGTGQTGIKVPGSSIGLPSVVATGQLGTLGSQMSKEVSGASATSAVGEFGKTATVSLPAVQATGAAGALGASFSKALAGAQGTANTGTVVPSVSTDVALTGVQATGQIGIKVPGYSIGLSSVAATGAAGTLGKSISIALSGVSATGAVGQTGIQLNLVGVQGTGATGVLAVQIARALSSVSATGAAGTVEPSTATLIALVGVQATGATGIKIPGDTIQIGSAIGTTASGSLGPSTTINLAGVQAAGASGSVDNTSSVSLPGVQVSGVLGTLGVAFAKQITGNESTGSIGTIVPSTASGVVLSGVQGTGQIGIKVPGDTIGLGSVSATGAIGSLATVVSKALVGVQATGAAGALGKTFSTSITGVQATSATGTFSSFGVSLDLSGVQATGATGTMAPSDATVVQLAGVQAVGAIGIKVPGDTIGLSSVVATGQLGSVTPSISKALTGFAVVGQIGNLSQVDVSIVLGGVQASGLVGTVEPAVQGDVTIQLPSVAALGVVGALGAPVAEVVVVQPGGTGGGGGGFAGVLWDGTKKLREARQKPVVEVRLVGARAKGAAGRLEQHSVTSLASARARAEIGRVEIELASSLDSVAAKTKEGNLSPQITVSLSGVGATGAAGTVGAVQKISAPWVQPARPAERRKAPIEQRAPVIEYVAPVVAPTAPVPLAPAAVQSVAVVVPVLVVETIVALGGVTASGQAGDLGPVYEEELMFVLLLAAA